MGNRYAVNKYGLTQNQENFCLKYVECGIGYQAYIHAYPKSKSWSRNAVDVNASKLLCNNNIKLRIEQLNAEKEKNLQTSLNLNKRKLIETALNAMIECNTPSERQHFVNILKMLFQKENLLNENKTEINITNNTSVADVSQFLDL